MCDTRLTILRKSRIGRIVLAVLWIQGLIWLARPTGVLANAYSGSCAGGGHVGDTACMNDGQSNQYLGLYGQWENKVMQWNQAPNSFYHVNNELWLYDNVAANGSGQETSFVETGLRYGAASWYPGVLKNQVLYAAFYASTDTSGNEFDGYISNPSMDGSTHGYEILRDPNPLWWDIYYDGVKVGVAQYAYGYGQTSTVGYEVQTGLEISQTPGGDISWAYSQTFHNSNLQAEKVSLRTFTYWTFQNHHRDMPCGQGWSVPQCTNGSEPSASEWDVNKPTS